jgi:hypothetical protein
MRHLQELSTSVNPMRLATNLSPMKPPRAGRFIVVWPRRASG